MGIEFSHLKVKKLNKKENTQIPLLKLWLFY